MSRKVRYGLGLLALGCVMLGAPASSARAQEAPPPAPPAPTQAVEQPPAVPDEPGGREVTLPENRQAPRVRRGLFILAVGVVVAVVFAIVAATGFFTPGDRPEAPNRD